MTLPLRLGVAFPQNELGADPSALRRFALAVEDLGYDHLLIYDHVVGAVHGVDRPIPLPEASYDEKDPFYDPFVAFAYLSALTQRIELITGILILPQRQTALVARQAADVAILSQGRLRLGVGVGYNPVEYEALGQDFRVRGRRLDEQVPYLRQLWTGEPISFDGQFDRIHRAAAYPPPPDPIPVWFGGFSEAAFQRAARLGDGFIFGYGWKAAAAEAWVRVQQLLNREGRTTEGFRAVFNLLPDRVGAESIASIVEVLPRLADARATDVTVSTARHGLRTVDEHLRFLAELKPLADRALG